MNELLSRVWWVLRELVTTGVFVVFQLAQFVLLLYLGYTRFYSPLAAAPGARDGAGLILVAMGVLFGVVVLEGVLAWAEASVVRWFIPEWRPPDDPG